MTHKCPNCQEVKPYTTEYWYRSKQTKSGLSSYCKVCNNAKSIAKRKQLVVSPKTGALVTYATAAVHKHRERPDVKLANSIASKKWYDAHGRTYYKQKRETEPLYRLKLKLRTKIRNLTNTVALLGCSALEFKAHIEAQFMPGMTWSNCELWHIDHIVPCSIAKTNTEVYELFRYTNLQPLWAENNLTKGTTIMKPTYLKEWHPWFFHYALTHRLYDRDFYFAYQGGHEL